MKVILQAGLLMKPRQNSDILTTANGVAGVRLLYLKMIFVRLKLRLSKNIHLGEAGVDGQEVPLLAAT